MNVIRFGMAAVLAAAAALPLAVAQDGKPGADPAGDGCDRCGGEQYGTSIQWEGTHVEAARKAKEQEKLVFVLHVSGNFEDPRFT